MAAKKVLKNSRAENKERAVGTVVVSEGVTSIKVDEFAYCDKLEKVILPEGLISIDDAYYEKNAEGDLEKIHGAFVGCTNFPQVSLESVTVHLADARR